MLSAMKKEIEWRRQNTQDDIRIISQEEIIDTIYFGGGTPSILSSEELSSLLNSIRAQYSINPEAEITLEANPDDINIQKLSLWKDAGINRLSIGIQSFIDRDLKWMNRAHNAAKAIECISAARKVGIANFSIDLIFGVPGATMDDWNENIRTAIDLEIPHIACYALTVEPRTALQKMIELKKKENVNNDDQAAQYKLLMRRMKDAGYEQYEISNFALPQFRSRHNSSYWQGKKYIGIGPSAHSYNGKNRMWNIANNAQYISAIEEGIIPFEEEQLSEAQKLNEYIMVALRTKEGIDLCKVAKHFSVENRNRLENITLKEVAQGLIIFEDDHLILTDKGKLLADALSVKLFV